MEGGVVGLRGWYVVEWGSRTRWEKWGEKGCGVRSSELAELRGWYVVEWGSRTRWGEVEVGVVGLRSSELRGSELRGSELAELKRKKKHSSFASGFEK